MGQVTLDIWAGGAVIISTGSNLTLRWWANRRVQTIRATSAGLTMTIQSATAYTNLPWGPQALIIINPKDATNSFTLRDQAPTWSFSVIAGRAVFISRVLNGSGAPTWWPYVRVIK